VSLTTANKIMSIKMSTLWTRLRKTGVSPPWISGMCKGMCVEKFGCAVSGYWFCLGGRDSNAETVSCKRCRMPSSAAWK
jgi:hypothetical protein